MSVKLKGLRERRAKVRAELERLGTKLHTESRAMTAEEKTALEHLKTDWTTLSEQIRAVEADIQAIDALVNAEPADPAADPQMNSRRPGAHGRDRRMAFQAWARSQHGLPLREEHRDACRRAGINPRQREFEFRIGGPGSILRSGVRRRALSTTAAGGGYTIAEGFSGIMEQALLDYSSVRGVADEFSTDTGADTPYPTEDDTTNTGEIVGEGAETAFADSTFGSVLFRAFKFSSKGILITHELLNDSEFDLEAYIAEQAGIRIGRIQGARYTTGTGTGQPQGIVVAASAGITTAGAAAFTADELTRLAFSVDRAYRLGPKVGYMMHDSVMAYALLLKDAENRPLLRESYRDGIAEPTINGFPVHVNQFMEPTVSAVPVTAKKHVLFGDFGKYKIRDVGTVRLRRLDERYAEKDQIGFVAFQRSDGRCVNSGAIKYMVQA